MLELISNPNNRLEIDYSSMVGDARIVCLGDSHIGWSFKDEIANAAQKLKTCGITHLAMELLGTDFQPLLDAYFESHDKHLKNEISDRFFEVWDEGTEEDQAELRVIATKFTNMVECAAANGIKTLAIEPQVRRMFASNGGYFQIQYGQEKIPEGLVRNSEYDWGDQISFWRDDTWTKIVGKALEETGSKIAIFAGSGHFGYGVEPWPPNSKVTLLFNELMEKRGFPCTVIQFAGGDYPCDFQRELNKQHGCPISESVMITESAEAAGVGHKLFALKMDSKKPRHADWYIHFPRITR